MKPIHTPGEPKVIRYPGGKNGWIEIRCVACTYYATESTADRAMKRVMSHCDARNNPVRR